MKIGRKAGGKRERKWWEGKREKKEREGGSGRQRGR